MRLCALALSLACIAPAGATLAQAAAPVAVRLHVPDCLDASSDAVKHLVALELAPHLRVLEADEQANDQTTLIGAVACTEPLVAIEVRDPARAAPLRVELDLTAAAPLARARLLALTLAELITTSRLEGPEAAPEPQALEPTVAQPIEDDDAARITLWVAPSVALATAPIAPLVGGDLGASYAIGAWLIAAGVHARFGQSDRSASAVLVRSFGASVALTPMLLDGDVRLSAGPALHAGYAALSATSRSDQLKASSLSGVWLAPAAQLALQLPLAEPTALRIALEAGYYARSVVGLDERGDERIALRGPWLALSIGLALRLF